MTAFYSTTPKEKRYLERVKKLAFGSLSNCILLKIQSTKSVKTNFFTRS